MKKETIEKVLLAIEELTIDLHQDLKKETTVEVHLVKKVVNLLSSKKSLGVLKKNLLKKLPRNLYFNLKSTKPTNFRQFKFF